MAEVVSDDQFPSLGMRYTTSEIALFRSDADQRVLGRLKLQSRPSQTAGAFPLGSVIPMVTEGVSAAVEDSFTKCFENNPPEPWNWNIYLFPAWVVGVLIRHLILFPLRLTALILGAVLFVLLFSLVKLLPKSSRSPYERRLIQFLCSVFVLSWSGVIRFHDARPAVLPGELTGVFVANHSSMIDFIVLQQTNCYAVVGQKHPGWCIWFDRAQVANRAHVAEQLREHVRDANRCPLLIFPEGTCVNNRHVMQFKKSVFELGVPVNPIAIKYNPIFVEGYWNSRAQSFAMHLFTLMTSWAVVCDVWFLEPQTQRPGEDAVQFANRVKDMIAERGGMKSVEWDGYMKYWAPSERFIQV